MKEYLGTFTRISTEEEEEVTDEDAPFKELFMSKTEMEEKDIPVRSKNFILIGARIGVIKDKFKEKADIYQKDNKIWIKGKHPLRYK